MDKKPFYVPSTSHILPLPPPPHLHLLVPNGEVKESSCLHLPSKGFLARFRHLTDNDSTHTNEPHRQIDIKEFHSPDLTHMLSNRPG